MKRTGFSLLRNTWRKHPKIKPLIWLWEPNQASHYGVSLKQGADMSTSHMQALFLRVILGWKLVKKLTYACYTYAHMHIHMYTVSVIFPTVLSCGKWKHLINHILMIILMMYTSLEWKVTVTILSVNRRTEDISKDIFLTILILLYWLMCLIVWV